MGVSSGNMIPERNWEDPNRSNTARVRTLNTWLCCAHTRGRRSRALVARGGIATVLFGHGGGVLPSRDSVILHYLEISKVVMSDWPHGHFQLFSVVVVMISLLLLPLGLCPRNALPIYFCELSTRMLASLLTTFYFDTSAD